VEVGFMAGRLEAVLLHGLAVAGAAPGLEQARLHSLVCAAMSMNVAISQLLNQLGSQRQAHEPVAAGGNGGAPGAGFGHFARGRA
jgi:hypothetical protein